LIFASVHDLPASVNIKGWLPMASEKSTTRTTVTLEDDLKSWVEGHAMRNRRDFSAQLNAILEAAKTAEATAPRK
jgi:hypothetical protein